MDFPEDLATGRAVEVYEYVAYEDEVERAERVHFLAQIELFESNHLADLVAQLPIDAVSLEIFQQIGRRKAAIHLDLEVAAGAGAVDHLLVEVGSQNLDIPIAEGLFGEHHTERIGFLAGGRSGGPEA